MDTPKVYVAGSISEPIHVQVVQEEVKKWGLEISYDWTLHTRSFQKKEMQKEGMADLQGVEDAQIVIAIFVDPKHSYRGTCTEIGYALGRHKEVIVLDGSHLKENQIEGFRTNPFLYHPKIHRVTCVNDVKRRLIARGFIQG